MSLASLPHDLQYTLLHTVATFAGALELLSLAHTSSSFYRIFHRSHTLIHAALYSRIGEFAPLAIRLATGFPKESNESVEVTQVPTLPASLFLTAAGIHRRFSRFASFVFWHNSLILANVKDWDIPESDEDPPALQEWVRAVYTYATDGFPVENYVEGKWATCGTIQTDNRPPAEIKGLIDEIIYRRCYDHAHPKQPEGKRIFYNEPMLRDARKPLVEHVVRELYAPLTGWKLASELLGENAVEESPVGSAGMPAWEYWCELIAYGLDEEPENDERWINEREGYENLTRAMKRWQEDAWKGFIERRELVVDGLWEDISLRGPSVITHILDIRTTGDLSLAQFGL